MSTALVSRWTKADALAFAQAFNRLALGTRITPDASGNEQRVYQQALEDLPISAIVDAAGRLLKKPDGFFPKTGEWRAAAEHVIADRHRDLQTVGREQPWQLDCERCSDTCWVQYECTKDARCGRPFCARADDSYTHTSVSRCACFPHNASYNRNHVVPYQRTVGP